jgi:hypothetical protein
MSANSQTSQSIAERVSAHVALAAYSVATGYFCFHETVKLISTAEMRRIADWRHWGSQQTGSFWR